MCVECGKMIKCKKRKPKQDFDELQVQEACAQFILAVSYIKGSRTKVGKVLCEVVEDIRNGRWRAFTIYKVGA